MTWIILGIIVVVALFVVSTYNGLVRKRTGCEEAFSTMDVYLKKRFDLIPNLVETVKGYAKHEAATLEKVVQARNAGTIPAGMKEREAMENQISGALRQIFALSEQYPDLKANVQFQELMGQLKQVEDDIAQSRKYYNAVVKGYNISCMTFPSNVVANLFHFEKKEMFEVENVAERQNVKVSF